MSCSTLYELDFNLAVDQVLGFGWWPERIVS